MRRATFFGLLIGLALVPCFAFAAEPEGEQRKPTAAELVEGVIAEEAKVEGVRSLYLRFEGKWTRPLPALAREIAEMKGRNENVDVEKNSNLWPEMTDELEWAFDKKRVRKFTHWHKSSWDLRVYDGQRGVAHEKSFPRFSEHYSLVSSPRDFFATPWGDLSWLRMGPHKFWFEKQSYSPAEQMQTNGLPKDYAFLDDADYRGRLCYVVENRLARRRLYIGKDDHRLHGLQIMVVPNNVDLLPLINLAAEREFASVNEADVWAKKLSDEDRRKYYERLNVAMFALMRPWVEHVLDDYREIAPGFWFPATQGYTLFDTKLPESPAEMSRELRLIEAKVNEPLDDRLFTIELKDGVQVYDQTRDPILTYVQDSKRTPEEWQKLIEEQKQRNAEWKKEERARNALVGKPAPELPESTWINSPPQSLASLKGKVVVLDFWATNCGPCRNDLPIAEAIHKASKETGIVVIGVHAADTEPEDVRAFVKEQNLSYPIVIDLPPPMRFTAFGQLSSQLAIRGIPHSFVIDKEGTIAGHGPLRDVLRKAEELAAGEKK